MGWNSSLLAREKLQQQKQKQKTKAKTPEGAEGLDRASALQHPYSPEENKRSSSKSIENKIINGPVYMKVFHIAIFTADQSLF